MNEIHPRSRVADHVLDGGWGWAIVFASFMIHAIADGVIYSFGIIYEGLLHYYGESKSITSSVISLTIGVSFLTGPISSAFTNKFGCRVVTIAGSLLAAFGLLLSSLAPSLSYLFPTMGIMTGVGLGLMSVPSMASVSCFFEKKRALAYGIALCGTGIGTFAIAPLEELFLEWYDLDGTLLLVAGIVLNCSVFGSLLTSMNTMRKTKDTVMESSDGMNQIENGTSDVSLVDAQSSSSKAVGQRDRKYHSDPLPRHLTKYSVLHWPASESSVGLRSPTQPGLMYYKDILFSGIPSPVKTSSDRPAPEASLAKAKRPRKWCPTEIADVLCDLIDTKLLTQTSFVLFAVLNALTSIGFNIPYVYIKVRMMKLGIVTHTEGSFIIAIIGISNTFGRIFVGCLADRLLLNTPICCCCILGVCSVGTILVCFATEFYQVTFYCVLFGLSTGMYTTLMSVMLIETVGLENFTNAFGLMLMLIGFATIIGPPLTGVIYDKYGSFDPGFYLSAAVMLVSCVMLYLISKYT